MSIRSRTALALVTGLAAGPARAEVKAAPDVKRPSVFVTLQAPMFSDAFDGTPVAKVEDEIITVRELREALSSTHQSGAMPAAGSANAWTAVLDRLVDLRLLAVDARSMDVDDKPEFKDALAEHSDQFLRELFKGRLVRDIKPDPAEVDRLVKDATREWKLRSVQFKDKAEAEKAAKAIAAGKAFDDVVNPLVAEKKAEAPAAGDFMPADRFLPDVVAAVSKLPVGGVAGPLPAGPGFALIRVDDLRHADDPRARAEAERHSFERQESEKLKKVYADLVKKYAVIDRKLLDRVDLESKTPGVEALSKDTRPVATISGGKAITVAELVGEVARKFFHGADSAIREKRVNVHKAGALETLLYRRLFLREALAQGLKDTDEYRADMHEFTLGRLVDTYAQKVIFPEVKVTEQEAQAYYEEHKAEYTSPALVRLETLGFKDVRAAQAALDKLRAGADWGWVKANAEGQLAEIDRKLDLDGTSTVTVASLGRPLGDTITGTKTGDVRLYEHPEGGGYLVIVRDSIPSKTESYLERRDAIGKALIGKNLTKAVAAWGKKLREHYEVRVYVTKIGND